MLKNDTAARLGRAQVVGAESCPRSRGRSGPGRLVCLQPRRALLFIVYSSVGETQTVNKNIPAHTRHRIAAHTYLYRGRRRRGASSETRSHAGTQPHASPSTHARTTSACILYREGTRMPLRCSHLLTPQRACNHHHSHSCGLRLPNRTSHVARAALPQPLPFSAFDFSVCQLSSGDLTGHGRPRRKRAWSAAPDAPPPRPRRRRRLRQRARATRGAPCRPHGP
jgi:hypothetical protein